MWRRVIVLTGCDAGLGYRFALEAAGCGLTVVAGFLGGDDAPAAQLMRSQLPEKSAPLHTVGLDVTDDKSVADAANYVADLLAADKDHCLYAVVNNAGVMIHGEFEWQTLELIRRQIDVNLVGTMRVSKAFMPMLRRAAATGTVDTLRPRLMVVGSHCGIQPLPLLSIYGATKAGLEAWCEAVRMELKPFGVYVINFLPGSMVGSTNIMSNHIQYLGQMLAAFTEEMISAHGANIDIMLDYFKMIPLTDARPPDSVQDKELLKKFRAALLDAKPKPTYKNEDCLLRFYHQLFSVSPMRIRHWLVRKYAAVPEFKYNKMN